MWHFTRQDVFLYASCLFILSCQSAQVDKLTLFMLLDIFLLILTVSHCCSCGDLHVPSIKR